MKPEERIADKVRSLEALAQLMLNEAQALKKELAIKEKPRKVKGLTKEEEENLNARLDLKWEKRMAKTR
jgi:hypothetical protein